MTKAKLKVLYLEDNLDDAELVELQLRREGILEFLTRVDTRQEFVEAVRNDTFNVILSDHSLPQFNSSEALKICQRVRIDIPFILVTGTMSEEFAVQCLKLGADDYVLKSNLARLPSAIVNAIRQRDLERERRKVEITLRRQNEELVKINQELDSFVYSVSHNLRAPLLSVIGLLNIAEKDPHERHAVYNEYFRMMYTSVHRLDVTLKEILDYSRNARESMSYLRIDFSTLTQENLEKLRYLEGYDRLDVRVSVEGEDWEFFSDLNRLGVLWSNLLSNAIKYLDSTKDRSYLFIRITKSKQIVKMVFEDNGIGIPEQLVPKVFRMFFRATERSDGAGLGLYIVKETVDKLGGTIEISSSQGKGTVITITLPNVKS